MSLQTRAAGRQLTVFRKPANASRLCVSPVWGFAKSFSSAPGEQGTSTSKYSKLLGLVDEETAEEKKSTESFHQKLARGFKNTPIFTSAVEKYVQSTLSSGKIRASDLVPQYGLIGSREPGDGITAELEDRLIMGNVNMPWSAFICGSQGAGKSHTLCCLLENALVPDNEAGVLPSPLAGMVMHYDNYSSHNSTQLCEAAYLCSSGIPVTILVSPSNIWAMKRLYSNLPGLPPGSPKPKILPLYLNEDQLDVTRILKLMSVDPKAPKTPLYMDVVMSIIREMAMEGKEFTYSSFRERVNKQKWDRSQRTALDLRLQLLDSFMAPSDATLTPKPAQAEENIWAFQPGSLTIVDLSDPFVNSDEACSIFTICLSIFLEERHRCGRIIALDEAHKFLTQGGEARILTNELISVIRQQRHTGTRVAVATQEPTLSPELIALSNATFVHRFLSPNWYETLRKHLAGANKQDRDVDNNTLFTKIVGLRTGQALLFCPTARMDVDTDNDGAHGGNREPKPLNDGYVDIQVRKRLTADGGKSIMATDASLSTPQTEVDDIPMFYPKPRPTALLRLKMRQTMRPETDILDTLNRYPRLHDATRTYTFQVKAQLWFDLDQPAGELDETDGPTIGDIISEALPLAHYLATNRNWKSFSSVTRRGRTIFMKEVMKKHGFENAEVRSSLLSKWLPAFLDPYMREVRKKKKRDSGGRDSLMKPSPTLEMKKLNGSPGEALEIREALNELQKQQPVEEAASTENMPEESESTVDATEEGKATEEDAKSEEGEKAAEQPQEEKETAEVEEASKTEAEKEHGQG